LWLFSLLLRTLKLPPRGFKVEEEEEEEEKRPLLIAANRRNLANAEREEE